MNTTQVRYRLNLIFQKIGYFVPPKDEDMLLDIDSLQFVVLIVEIEHEFSIRIRNEDFEKLNSFTNILEVVSNRLNEVIKNEE